MDDLDQTLLQMMVNDNPRFRLLYEEHLLLEKELRNMGERPHLSPEEEVERKKVQKMKLAGKDEMVRMLRSYRRQ